MVGRYEPHPSHVGRQCIRVVDATSRLQAVIPPAQIENLKFVSIDACELRILQVDTANPVATLFEERHEMVADKATRTRYQDSFHLSHPSVSISSRSAGH